MAHTHSSIDPVAYFSIDPATGIIKHESGTLRLGQTDHNSTRYGFSMPRFVGGHDMSLCNKLEVHFVNVSSDKKQKSSDVYPVTDVQVNPADDSAVSFSWLISGNATEHAGILSFVVRFACLTGETIDYDWHTDIFSDITVSDGINNGEALAAEYSDVLEAWKKEVVVEIEAAKNKMLEEIELAAEIVQNLGDSETAAMSQLAVTKEILNIDPMVDVVEKLGNYTIYGNYVDSADYHHQRTQKIPCKPGDEFVYYGFGSGAVASWIFYNSAGVALSSINGAHDSKTNGSIVVKVPETGQHKVGDGWSADFEPVSVMFQSFAAVANAVTPLNVYRVGSTVDALMKQAGEIEDIKEDILCIDPMTNAVEELGNYDAYGAYNNAENYHHQRTQKIPCKPGDEFVYYGFGSGAVASWIFYNSAGIALSSINGAHDSKTNGSIVVKVPETGQHKVGDGWSADFEPVSVMFQSFAAVANAVTPLNVYRVGSTVDALMKQAGEIEDIKEDILRIDPMADVVEELGNYTVYGNYVDSENYHHQRTQKIPCKPGDKFVYYGYGTTNVASWIFYNSAGMALYTINGGHDSRTNGSRVVEVPKTGQYKVGDGYSEPFEPVCVMFQSFAAVANAVTPLNVYRVGISRPFDPFVYSLPIVYFDGDITGMNKDDKVTLNYRYVNLKGEGTEDDFNRTGTCTLKWQGSSSLAYPKKNYTVTFDYGFEASEGWGVHNKYCLKADWIDFSHCRNVCSAKLWGQIVKSRTGVNPTLSALPNGGAIDGFPCFVVINGEWKGIYNFNIPKEDWMLGMGSGTKEAILCGENSAPGNRFEAEAAIGSDYELEYNSDSFAEAEIQDSFNTLVRAVINTDGSDIDTTIAQYLDIDSAIDYYILVAITYGLDIVAKNAIFATFDGAKWFMSAYDLDSTWGLHWNGKSILAPSDAYSSNSHSFHTATQHNNLFKMLYEHKKAEIVARYKELRKSILSPSNISVLFRNYAKNIPYAAFDAENVLWPDRPSSNVSNVDQIISWYYDRIAFIDAEIAEMEEKIEQVATDGFTYALSGHGVFGDQATITGIGTVIDTDIVVPKWIGDAPVTKIDENVFTDNLNIESVEIPEGVRIIPFKCFSGAKNLTSVKLPSTIEIINPNAFVDTALVELVIPNSVTWIRGAIALRCTKLTSVKMGNRVTKIDENAFRQCSLENVRLPDHLKTIGLGAFNMAYKAASLTIPKKVETIGENAFNGAANLKIVKFKGTPTSIAETAFSGMGSSVTDKSTLHIYVPWAEGEVAGAPWGATNATIHYDSTT